MRLAESRNWTEAEVQEAVGAIKAEPGLWEELERVEKTTGDFTGTEVARKERAALLRLHPECEHNEITDLYIAVRVHRRSQLGIA